VSRTLRNVVIVVAIATAVWAIPAADRGADVAGWFVGLAFLAAMAGFAAVGYRHNRYLLRGLTESSRLLLYGSFAMATLTLLATDRMWDTGGGTLAWFVLIGAAAAGVITVAREFQGH
jgi:hypothetical protein